MNPQGNWLEFVTVDQAMTHAFMGFVAAMHNALAEWDDTTTIDFHRYEAVKYINQRLNSEGRNFNSPLSDGILVAVSMLVNIESFTGSVPSARAHMMGLKKMVELRGGIIDGLSYSTLLQRALAWADFAYATASQTSLSFPFIPVLGLSPGMQDQFLSRSMMLNTALAGQGRHLSLKNREALEVYESLYSVTEAINNFEFAKLEDLRDQRGQMSNSIYMIEYRLCKLEESVRSRRGVRLKTESLPVLQFSNAEEGDSPMGTNEIDTCDISDGLVYASHLFMHLALRGHPPQARGHRASTEALMASLYDMLLTLDLVYDTAPNSATEPMFTKDSPDTSVSGRSSIDSWPGSVSASGTGTDSTKAHSVLDMSESPPMEKTDELHEDILLWILYMASCVQIPRFSPSEPHAPTYDYRRFFLGVLRRYCTRRGILDKEVLSMKLRGVLWLNSWCEKQLDMIWARIGNELGV
ncbi:hypothetical protein BX600DRAFT_465189 [Xylariales sp. PMI_506]|nr:hypothetical protein BX600DRAFT_465189 [Xylariales sp. PMI_506]